MDRSLESNTYTLMSYEAPAEAWYGSGNWAISYTPMILNVALYSFFMVHKPIMMVTPVTVMMTTLLQGYLDLEV